MDHNYCVCTVPPELSPVLTYILHCPVGHQVQITRSKIKLLRLSKWQQESLKPSMGSFSEQDPVLLHRFLTHRISSAATQFSLQSNAICCQQTFSFPSILSQFGINWTRNTNSLGKGKTNWEKREGKVGNSGEKLRPEAGLRSCKPLYDMLEFVIYPMHEALLNDCKQMSYDQVCPLGNSMWCQCDGWI